MSNDMDVEPGPLPREWLPEPLPPEGDASWEARVARIMAAAERQTGAGGASWWAELARWWGPTAALAAAAVAALVFVVADTPRPESPSTEPTEGLALTMIAADGDPVALWAALGVAADPVLALLTLEDHSASPAPAPSEPTPSAGVPR
ncbi:MAG: hypothetical protein WD995_07630 [Gemmatimonadota bacterium]